MRINYGDFCAYLTGDLDKELLETIVDKSCPVLKVSHHGSKTGTSQELMDLISPEISIIQVGEKNRYKHPHQEALDVLIGTQILRNDQLGTIEITSDGQSYSIN